MVPRYIWRICCGSIGVDISHIIRMTSSVFSYRDIKKKNIKNYLIFVIKQMNNHCCSRNKSNASPIISSNTRFVPIIVVYIFIKLIYIGVAIGEIFLIQIFLQMKTFYFPIKMLTDFSKGKTWSDTGQFPVVTWCRVMVRENTDLYYRNIQCTLPSNVIYEKLSLGIWFSLVIGIFMMVINIFYWIYQIAIRSGQSKFIRRELIFIIDVNKQESKLQIKHFMKDFLAIDGLFLLHILKQNMDNLSFQNVLEDLWNYWNKEVDIV